MKVDKSFILFCMVGAVSATIDIVLLYLFFDVFGLDLYLSATLSFSIGATNGYLLNHKYTFRSDNDFNIKQYLQFMAISIVGLLMTVILLHIFVEWVGLYYLIAKIITVGLVVFWNYGANKLFTFK